MAFTQTELDALKALYAQGIRSATVNGRSVTYASAAEMWAAIRLIESEVNPPTVTRRPNVRNVRFREPT